ncbi:MAG: class I SAM-dependent methyltransferase [Deltaproteobacteria bacterium]|jgi:SAM-dependent methyltransferase|nr:class I SAM-dependent methyltransferase [Deltaproteobacteria bacterium]
METLFDGNQLEKLKILSKTNGKIDAYIPPVQMETNEDQLDRFIFPEVDLLFKHPKNYVSQVVSGTMNSQNIDNVPDKNETEEIELTDVLIEDDDGEDITEEINAEEIEVDEINEDQQKDPPAPPPPTPATNSQEVKPPPTPATNSQETKPPPTPVKFKKSKNWSNNFFDDDYLISAYASSNTIIDLEVDFLTKHLNLNENNSVLDVGCGDGSHTVRLIKAGYNTTGIDISVPFLLQSSRLAQVYEVEANFIKKDIRDFKNKEPFDAIFCIGGTFGYYKDQENEQLLCHLKSLLKPGGRLIIEVINRDFAISVLPTRIWWESDDCMIMDESYFIHKNSRVYIKRNTIFTSGKQKNKKINIRTYSIDEWNNIVTDCGFKNKKLCGSFLTPDEFLGQYSPSIISVLENPE